MSRCAHTLPTVRVAQRSSQGAHKVAVARLACMRVITRAQVIHMRGAAVTAETPHAILARTLSAFLITRCRSFHGAPGITVARPAAMRVHSGLFVPAVVARVTPTARYLWPAHTLTCYRVAHWARNDASSAAVAGHADPVNAQAIGARRAHVTEETLDTVLTFTLAGKRVAKLVERSVWITAARLTAIWIGVVEKLEAVVTTVTGEAWKQNRKVFFFKECSGSPLPSLYILDLHYSNPCALKKLEA